jgi:purine-binding chemotaxis protein CheW
MLLADADDLRDLDRFVEHEEDEEDRAGLRTLVTFRLDRQVFAVDVTHVREIVDVSEIAPLPGAPPSVLGMIDLRGETIAIIDLASHLGLPDRRGADSRIIVFSFGHEEEVVSLGVVAQQVLRVCEVTSGGMEPMPHTTAPWRNADVVGLVMTEDGKAIVLDTSRILRSGGDLPGEFDFG